MELHHAFFAIGIVAELQPLPVLNDFLLLPSQLAQVLHEILGDLPDHLLGAERVEEVRTGDDLELQPGLLGRQRELEHNAPVELSPASRLLVHVRLLHTVFQIIHVQLHPHFQMELFLVQHDLVHFPDDYPQFKLVFLVRINFKFERLDVFTHSLEDLCEHGDCTLGNVVVFLVNVPNFNWQRMQLVANPFVLLIDQLSLKLFGVLHPLLEV